MSSAPGVAELVSPRTAIPAWPSYFRSVYEEERASQRRRITMFNASQSNEIVTVRGHGATKINSKSLVMLSQFKMSST